MLRVPLCPIKRDHGRIFFRNVLPQGTTKAERGGNVWLDIAGALPHRSPKQVWAWGTRHFHPDNHKGKWSAEEDAELTRRAAFVPPRANPLTSTHQRWDGVLAS